jgi:hypothetical protein
MASPTSFAELPTRLTTTAVGLLHHDFPVKRRPSSWPALWSGPTSNTAPGSPQFLQRPWNQRRTLLNRLAAYAASTPSSSTEFDGKTKDDLETWFASHCNVPALRAQCSMLGLLYEGLTKKELALRLLEAGARPMFPSFIGAWLEAYAALIAGRRDPGPLSAEEFQHVELLDPIDPAPSPSAINTEMVPPAPRPPSSAAPAGEQEPAASATPARSVADLQEELRKLRAQLAAADAPAVSAEPARDSTLGDDGSASGDLTPASQPERSGSENIVFSEAMALRLVSEAAKAAAVAAAEVYAGSPQAAASSPSKRKLTGVARLKETALEQFLAGEYIYLPSLSPANCERVRKAGVGPRKRSKINGVTVEEIDSLAGFSRSEDDPVEEILFQQGWGGMSYGHARVCPCGRGGRPICPP